MGSAMRMGATSMIQVVRSYGCQPDTSSSAKVANNAASSAGVRMAASVPWIAARRRLSAFGDLGQERRDLGGLHDVCVEAGLHAPGDILFGAIPDMATSRIDLA